MKKIKDSALQILEQKYRSKMEECVLNIMVYDNAVGIGEHPDLVGAVEEQVKAYSEAREMWESIEHIRQDALDWEE